MPNSFEDLTTWKECRLFRREISKITKKFLSEEKYRLADQLIRSSRSVTANIAEGHGRYHYQEYIQFCRQSRGSLTETFDHLICEWDENYITEEKLSTLRNQ